VFAFHFTGNSSTYSNFWFDINRRARGYRHGRWYRSIGKGAAICEDGKPRIIVLSLGGPVTSGS